MSHMKRGLTWHTHLNRLPCNDDKVGLARRGLDRDEFSTIVTQDKGVMRFTLLTVAAKEGRARERIDETGVPLGYDLGKRCVQFF